MDRKPFLCVVRRGYNHLKLPKVFYNNYSARLPRSLAMEDKFGLYLQATVCVHSRNRAYLDCDSDEILDAYQYGDYVVARLTYTARGRFKLFVPYSSAYFTNNRPDNSARARNNPNGDNGNNEQAIEGVIEPVNVVHPPMLLANNEYDEILVEDGSDSASEADVGAVVE